MKIVLVLCVAFGAALQWAYQRPTSQMQATVVTVHQVNLTWQVPTSGMVSGYFLYKAGYRKNNWKKIATLTPLSVAYVDGNVTSGQAYQYRMQTYCTSCTVQNSPYSNTVSIQVP